MANVIDNTRQAKEAIRQGKHKNDAAQMAGATAAAGGAAAAGAAAATSTVTATTVTGAALGNITIGGGVGAWLVGHGATAAAITTTSTVFAAPVFAAVAVPALVGLGVFGAYKVHKSNQLLKDFQTTVDIDTLGRKIADCVFLPAVYFLKSLGAESEAVVGNLSRKMVKDYGFSEAFAKEFLEGAANTPRTVLAQKIRGQDAKVVIETADGKERVTRDLNLSHLRDLSLKLCKSELNSAAYAFGNEQLLRGGKVLDYIKKELFKKKKK